MNRIGAWYELIVRIVNTLIIVIIIAWMRILLHMFMKKSEGVHTKVEEKYDVESLSNVIKDMINKELRTDITNLNLNMVQAIKREKSRSVLRKQIQECNHGDLNAKNYVKQLIRRILQEQLNINEQTICFIAQFHTFNLTCAEKFSIILYIYKKWYRFDGLAKLIEEQGWDQGIQIENGIRFEVNEEQITYLYDEMGICLTFEDKINILTQWIYERIYGHGVIDEIRDMNIDGVSGGVGGLSDQTYYYVEEVMSEEKEQSRYSYNHICIMYQGKTIYLKFLGFQTQKELERVCKNLYRYHSPGQLSQERGHIENDMKDGSRVTVARPPMSNSWTFIVRKHTNLKSVELEDLLTDQGANLVIQFMKYLILARQNVIITGDQAAGKSTLLRAYINKIDASYNLRIQEAVPELHIEKFHPEKNVISVRETPTVTGLDALEFQKKTDGTVNIIGEIASYPVATWYIQTSQNASLMSIATNHCVTTDALLKWFRNALMAEANFHSEAIALEQVVEAIRFDIHMEIDRKTGHRYISRITEIVPMDSSKIPWPDSLLECTKRFYQEMTEKQIYTTNDIIVFENGIYVVKKKVSDSLLNTYESRLTKDEFDDFNTLWEEYAK